MWNQTWGGGWNSGFGGRSWGGWGDWLQGQLGGLVQSAGDTLFSRLEQNFLSGNGSSFSGSGSSTGSGSFPGSSGSGLTSRTILGVPLLVWILGAVLYVASQN